MSWVFIFFRTKMESIESKENNKRVNFLKKALSQLSKSLKGKESYICTFCGELGVKMDSPNDTCKTCGLFICTKCIDTHRAQYCD